MLTKTLGFMVIATAIYFSQSDLSFWSSARVPGSHPAGIERISLVSFLKYKARDKSCSVIDARGLVAYERGHIPGAMSFDLIREGKIVPPRAGNRLLIYCDGHNCSASDRAAEVFGQNGWSNVMIYDAGWEEWTLCSLPIDL